MSKHGDTNSVTELLARVLEAPRLELVVPTLAPETLHQIIRHRGLDACGEIVVAATAEQLTSVFDIDLWRSPEPGRDEAFDAERFGEWLAVLVDTGDAVAAETVAKLDEALVVAGLSRHLRVFDPGTFEPTESSDDERIKREVSDMTSSHGMTCEVGGYAVAARRTEAWDAIVALLVALEADHSERFHAVMRGCRRLSNDAPEQDGFHDLFLAPEQAMHDVSLDRERRRSQQGYSTPADARAFLEMARRREARATLATNPIAMAYVRAVDDAAAGEHVGDVDDSTYFRRSRQLAFLANTLMAGCSIQSRPFTPQEAADAVVGICNLGIEHWPETPATTTATTRDGEPEAALAQRDDALLQQYDLMTAFGIGWTVLYEEVALFAIDGLIAFTATAPDLYRLRRELLKQREAGTPWRARDALDDLAILDTPTWIGLLGVLDECPTMPAALTAIVEGRTEPVNATEFAFISTRHHLDTIRRFVARLPALLRA